MTRELIAALLATRSAVLVDVERTPAELGFERLLILSNLSGTAQLCEYADVGADMGVLTALTALPESVSDATYIPGPDGFSARRAILAIDTGGNERHQLYVIDLDRAAAAQITALDELRALTDDPAHGHHCAGISPDGRLVAYTSNKANGVDFDLWTVDLGSGEHRLLWASDGWAHPGSGFSPDGRFVSLLRSGACPLDHDLFLVDVETGEAQMPLPHPGDAALVDAPVWIDDRRFCVSTNAGRDFAAILLHDLESGSSQILAGTGEDRDSLALVRAEDGTTVLVENVDCATQMRRYEIGTGPGAVIPVLEAGLSANYGVPDPRLSADGRRLYYTLTAPRLNADVYRHDLVSDTATRLTTSPSQVAVGDLRSAELASITSFDGLELQLIVYRPPGDEASPPVVVLPHGGPASQSWRSFNPVIQALCAAGFGVVVPNVRGSTGYGKRFAALDDTVKRLDSVADLGAIHGALASLGFDPGRAALWGGSYGGYMVLAGVSMQPELWAAGVDIVGISDLVTFLENTSAYRRANREAEYGSLDTDRAFLTAASPMTHVDAIRAPLFVIHGRNDPRVPVGEAIQLEARLRAQGVECELAIYDNEGHGLSRLENRLDAYPRAIAFLQRVLGPSASPGRAPR